MDWLLYSLPWQWQAALIAVPVGIIFLVVGNLIGWDKVRGFILPAIAAIGALALLSRARQQGYTDRKKQEGQAQAKAEKTVEQQRREADGATDEQLDREIDRWSRRQ